MNKYTLTASFKGGSLDGEIMDNFPRSRLKHVLHMQRDSFFGVSGADAIGIYKGELNKSWFYYLVDIY
jgi:hypothetical protein